MFRVVFLIGVLSLALITNVAAQPHQAVGSTIVPNVVSWVSGAGLDANPCTRTAPCFSFAGAFVKTLTGGEIDALDSNSFGALTITKAITIDGSAGLAGVVVSGSINGLVVDAGGADVVILRNLVIDGTGSALSGIAILQAGDVRIEHCKIFGFQQGIFDNRVKGHLAVKDTVISDNSASGLIIDAGAASTLAVNLERVQMHNNLNAGFAITNGAHAVVSDSSATSNTHGIYADSAAVLDLNHAVVFGNESTGINAQTGALVRLFDTLITNNGFGLSNTAANIWSFGQNRIAGNIAADGSPNMSLPVQ